MEKQSPLISVIMPLYNAERFVGESIGNILGQTVGDFELIVIATPRRTPRTTSQAVMPRKTHGSS